MTKKFFLNVETSASVNNLCMSPHGIAGPPDQSSPNSGNNCPLVRPLALPNFIALGQTMYEKRITIFHTLQYFGASGDPLGSKLTSLGTDIQQCPDYQCAKFRPLLTTCLRDICCRTLLISLKRDRQTDKTSASVKD